MHAAGTACCCSRCSLRCSHSAGPRFTTYLRPQAHECVHGHREPVFLNVYDMCGLNGLTSPLGLGIFHSGVEVYGVEFGFDCCEIPTDTGIYQMHPRCASELGDNFRYRKSIFMGYTNYTKRDVEAIVAHLGRRFCGASYHLTKNNCNHFSNTLTRLLVGRGIPHWVNRLAYIVARVPLLRRCLPKDLYDVIH